MFFLSPIVGRLTTPVPKTVIADCGVHLMLYTKETGLTAVSFAYLLPSNVCAW